MLIGKSVKYRWLYPFQKSFFEIFQKSVLDILDIVASEYIVRLMKFLFIIYEKCV